jgi:hypothetical protein
MIRLIGNGLTLCDVWAIAGRRSRCDLPGSARVINCFRHALPRRGSYERRQSL